MQFCRQQQAGASLKCAGTTGTSAPCVHASIGLAPIPGVVRVWCTPVCRYRDTLITKAKELKVSAGHEQGTDVGPVISPESKERVERLIESGIKQVGQRQLRMAASRSGGSCD